MEQIERSFELVCAEWPGGPKHSYAAVHGGPSISDAEQLELARTMVEQAVYQQRGIAEIVVREWVDGINGWRQRTICVETLGLPVPKCLIDWSARPSWHANERFSRMSMAEDGDTMYGVDGVLATAECRVQAGLCWCCGRNELTSIEKEDAGLCFVCVEFLAATAETDEANERALADDQLIRVYE